MPRSGEGWRGLEAPRPGAGGGGQALGGGVRALALGAQQRAQARSSATALTAYASRIERRLAAYRRWGLPPLPEAPPPPEVKPRVEGAEVVRQVPTRDRVIFLTVDDGAEKDPEFIRMVRDLELPVTSFLTDYVARDDYDYFRNLQALGNGIHNHTINHRNLPRLSYSDQQAEICGQQEILGKEFGVVPRLFRPPYGNFDTETLRAARSCGLDGVVMWGVEAWADRVDFQMPDRRLRPGEIVLTHFRGPQEWGGTMTDMARRILRVAASQGFAVAHLDDYL